MTTFNIPQDMSNKENPVNLITAGVKNAKQPPAVIGKSGKNALAPRADFSVLNDNNNNTNYVPRPSRKEQLFSDVHNHYYDENVVPVVEQFKTFSVYEDNCDTQVVPSGKSKASVADKAAIRFDAVENVVVAYDLNSTPMSVTDVLSPMSIDRSILGVIQSNNSSDQNTGATPGGQVKESPPRNERQRFFEVVQYQMDILENFRLTEKKHRPKPMYMRRQMDINHNMRSILIDWLVEVSVTYNLDTETLYLSVFYLDRFLSLMAVVRSKLKLVGIAAMCIAAKYEENYPPKVDELVFLTDGSYTKAQVLRMEQVILKNLCFDLSTPTAYVFINTFAALCDMPERLKFLALYISELSLMEGETYLQYLPSLMSSASLALARHVLGMEMWTAQLEEITTYQLEDLKTVVLQLCHTHKTAKELNTQAMRKKYHGDKYKKVAMIESIEMTQDDFDQLCQAYDTKQNEKHQQLVKNSKSNAMEF
ncbi:G2/mitotic-specific cyclin-A-like [Drosophila eugracilis]|uniref:G2/mitotic-specific cyclin-A-like n=1 Tax=Drosophila eugracilis TaxID=29029 RepID=UPI0007E7122E|nr:G2/mitotic-specific cyclin-A-like [Drosophila eugracilis]